MTTAKSKTGSWRDKLPVAPACELFPPMSEAELRVLGKERNFLTNEIQTKRRRNAYHEAGHAVIARALGIEVIHVKMRPTAADDPKYAGIDIAEGDHCVVTTQCAAWNPFRRYPKSVCLRAWKASAKIMCAGRIAQERVYPDSIGDWAGPGAMFMSDLIGLEHATGHIALLQAGIEPATAAEFDEDGDGYMLNLNIDEEKAAYALRKPLERQTRALITKHWHAIERVAKVLQRRDYLNRSQLDQLIAGSGATS